MATSDTKVTLPRKRPQGLAKKPKYSQGQGLGDLELRAELEKYFYGNPLARLGYELYKEGKIDLITDKGRGTVDGDSYGLYLGQKEAKKLDLDQAVLQYVQTPKKYPSNPLAENAEQESNVDPLKVLVHEFTHAAIDVLEDREKNRINNLSDERAFLGNSRKVYPKPGFSSSGFVDYEEGVVRAGDELITGRTTGKSGTLGLPGYKQYVAPEGGLKDTPFNEKSFKNDFINLSKAAQEVLDDKGLPPEAVESSDNRKRTFTKVAKDFLGFERDRNKLNNLGFTQPIDNYENVYRSDATTLGDEQIKEGTRDPSDAYRFNEGGILMARQEPAGLGALPMTQKASPPVGNKKVKVEKMPKRGAAPKAPIDPRDEVMKLVAKKLKQDKTTVGIGSPTPGPVPTPMPTTTMPTPMTTALAAPVMPNDPNAPTPMKEGGIKDKKDAKGLAVVIDMSNQPDYEEASEGTPSDPPPGATSSEVKDDQHVLLSEGELVVPANVVRYHGLGMYEGLRRDALTGLGEMENSGQVEYVGEEVKTAAAGMTILNNQPNVATMTGIKKQQGQYNPALGQYGTAAAPAAASAKFVNTAGTFTDTNRDGIDDRLQPSVKPTGLAAPVTAAAPAAITPAALNMGPTSNPNTVVGAGNIGSYVNNQSGIPGSGGDTTPPVVETSQAPLVRRPVQEYEENNGEIIPETEREKAARELQSQRISRAKELGHNYNPLKQLAMMFLPGNFLGIYTQDAGTVTLGGNVVGNDGRTYDPLTGNVASSGSMVTDVVNKFTGVDISRQGEDGGIIPTTKDTIGFSPMTEAGIAQYTIEEMRKAIGDEQLLSKVNAEISNIQKENSKAGLASLQAPSLKAKDINDLTSKIIDNLESTTNFQAQRDGASAGPLSEEITTPDTRMTAQERNSLEKEPAYTSAKDSFIRSGITTAALLTIAAANDKYTVIQRAAAQDLAQEKQLSTIDAGDAKKAAEEKKFDVNETFGDGRSSKQVREDKEKQIREDKEMNEIFSNFENSAPQIVNRVSKDFDALADRMERTQTLTEKDQRAREIYDDGNDDGPSDPTSDKFESGTFTSGRQTAGAGLDQRDVVTNLNAGPTVSQAGDDPATEDIGATDKSIVCTEMYRQTQRDDWAQAMKTWYIYQKKYLTPIHEIGYHSLFRPFVRGMKVNKALTNLGAYLAKERTKHLRHILTKGKSADSIVGNIFCKIIHPIVYLVGLAVHKK